ncbi:MAG: TonB-dependent receptor [Candidatus Binatia bacterium]|nr:TonB-dependent receptor [Candidatus Binatia bacterium]
MFFRFLTVLTSLAFALVIALASASHAFAQDSESYHEGQDGAPDYTADEEAGTDPIPADEPHSFDEPEPGIEVVAPTKSRNEGIGVEELVVTAQKRAQNIQDVPISMTALTSQFIEDSGLTSVLDMSQYVPNVQINAVTDSRSTAIRIRGIGSDGNNAGIDASVGVFIDGVFQGRSGAASITDLADVERIEVLRGPQGTLYGKNTAAGAINVVSKKPIMNVWEGLIEGQAGNYQNRQVRGSINIPVLDDTVALRLSGYYVHRGPFDELLSGGGVNDLNRNGARLRGLFNITDDLELILWGDYGSESSKCCVADILTYEGFPNLDVVFSDAFASQIDGIGSLEGATGRPLPPVDPFDRVVDADQKSTNDLTIWGVAGELNYDIDDYIITWLNAYRQFSSFSILDGDFSSYDAVLSKTDEEFEQVSSELRVTSPYGEDLEYVAGLFFYYQKDNTVGQTGISREWFQASDSLRDLFLDLGEPDENGRIFNVDTNVHKTWSYAFFGQGTYHLADQWDVTIGVRGTYEEKKRVGTQISGFKAADAGIFGPDRFADEGFSVFNVSPMGALMYYPTEDAMVFAKIARGFKSGGFNQLRTVDGLDTRFDDEKATDVEAGIRTAWFDRMLTFNATFFYTWYDDFQSQAFDGSSFRVTNAGSLTSYGVETDGLFIPHPMLVAGFGTGYLHARYTDFDSAPCTSAQEFGKRIEAGNLVAPTGCIADLTGRPLDNAPEWTVSTFAQFTVPLGDAPWGNWSLLGFLRAEYSYRDRAYLGQDLDENLVQDPVNLVNLRGGIRTEDDAWELTFWTMNLTNESYNVVGFDVPIVSGFAAINGPPRTYGATLRYRWYP